MCWIAGALAARAYETEGFQGELSEALKRTTFAGCFAVGMLIIGTQAQLSAEFAISGVGSMPMLGDDQMIDRRLLVAAFEVAVDVASEAVAMLTWRAIRRNV